MWTVWLLELYWMGHGPQLKRWLHASGMLWCSQRMTVICWPSVCASTNGLNLVALQCLKWEVTIQSPQFRSSRECIGSGSADPAMWKAVWEYNMKIICRRNASTQTLGAGVHCAAEVLLKDTQCFISYHRQSNALCGCRSLRYALTLPCMKTEFKPICQAKLKRNLF